MNRSLAIFSLAFLICALFTPAWGQTNIERCEKAYKAKDYAAAYPACKEAAEQGNSAAQSLLGSMFFFGLEVKQDYARAAAWLRKAAEQGDAPAQYALALMYAIGDGVKQDSAEAAVWSRKAAEQGAADAQLLLGMLYYDGLEVKQDYAEAAMWYRKAAEQGNVKAQSELAGMYDKGQGVKQNYAEAVKWYRKAAEQGDADAQYLLGSCYERGDGVKQDYSEAVKLYRAAAKQGHMKAEYNLGVLYANGTGVEKNYKEAIKWYQMAAETDGSAEIRASAQAALGYMYVNGYGVSKDQIQALMYWEISSAQGNTTAASNKKQLLHKMSSANIAEAQKMARAWLDERGIPSDKVGSVDVNNDNSNMVRSYEETTTPIKIEDFLLDLLKKSAEFDIPDAQYELAERYIRGAGVEKNRRLAEKWLVRSVLNDSKNIKSLELIEKEFGWHCILGCSSLINKTSIKHDKNFSWYWTLYLMKIEIDKKPAKIIFRKYNVMNCNNRTEGYKTFQVLDYDLHVVPERELTIADDKIEFKPIEPGAYSDGLFNYVCGLTDVDKKAEDVHEVSFGTGWPIQPGYIVTNQHVVNGKKKITVVSTSGKKISATVLIEDKINDLAVLQVDHPEKLPPALPIAKASAKTGSKVFTIGYPHPDIMGAKPKLTEGIVNALSGYMDDPRILQISVPVQSGNSGGPLLNMNGEVIGIVTAKLSAVKMFNWTGDLPQNVNYAVKATYITALLESVKEQPTGTKMLPVQLADLESLSSRIQNSVFLIIAE